MYRIYSAQPANELLATCQDRDIAVFIVSCLVNMAPSDAKDFPWVADENGHDISDKMIQDPEWQSRMVQKSETIYY